MAKLQKQFVQFHETIKLNNLDENKTLRDKRDIVLEKLRERLKKFFQEKDEPTPTFEPFNQGSYAMGTGIQPLGGDYDIDVGLKFNISKEDYPDPTEVKQWVYDALSTHTQRVEFRKPCITIFYQRHNEPIYHVDLAIYSEYSYDSSLYIAKGKPNSDERIWEASEPKKLIELVKNRFDDPEDGKQFRRVIRYLKRWKDVKFSSDGNGAPIGIGITIAAYHWLNVSKPVDYFSGKTTYDDLTAMQNFVNALIGNFRDIYNSNELRLHVELPVAPYCDVFEKMTDNHMLSFKRKLESLLSILNEAQAEAEPSEACQKLQQQFGDDFPIPTKAETAFISSAPAIVSSSSSA
ncbi:MAG: nucleotidyltransferase [Candidatus Parabeggiatoa sp. nov. 3]|nr:MAG: nucleotidyltransferase [Gammaproteobacteria bacterium]RKZ62648.1 MAG: nucleotidyltransferase [Gammaproteobacteria bacterium]RKZ89462.1 MAG: nucleotidyltransferase [Gammaproteobacteria bacterium]